MFPNRLRQLIEAGKPSLGTHVQIPYPGIIELVGHSRQFDYVEFVGEYAPYDLMTLENLGRAIELHELSGMMKIEQDPRLHLTIRAIGSGIQNVLFADVRTVEDVRECVRAVRAESPTTGGLHGVGMRRDVGYVVEPGSPAFVQALEDAVVALMIEKKEAVENLPTLLAVKGVDMVQFGPADYSMSIGLAGEWNDPAVQEAEAYVIATALKGDIAPRAEISNPEDARKYLEMGVKHFCLGWDVRILHGYFTKEGWEMRNILESI